MKSIFYEDTKEDKQILETYIKGITTLLYGDDEIEYGYHRSSSSSGHQSRCEFGYGIYETMDLNVAYDERLRDELREELILGRKEADGERVKLERTEKKGTEKYVKKLDTEIPEKAKLFSEIRKYISLYEKIISEPIGFGAEEADRIRAYEFIKKIGSLDLMLSFERDIEKPLEEIKKEILKQMKHQGFNTTVLIKKHTDKNYTVKQEEFDKVLEDLFSKVDSHISARLRHPMQKKETKLNDSVIAYLKKKDTKSLEELLIKRQEILDGLENIEYCTKVLMLKNDNNEFENLNAALKTKKAELEKELKKIDKELKKLGLSYSKIENEGNTYIQKEQEEKKVQEEREKEERARAEEERKREEEHHRLMEEADRIRKKMASEKEQIQQRELFDEIYPEVRRKMALSGWKPENGMPLKEGYEVDGVAYDREFDAATMEATKKLVEARMTSARLSAGKEAAPTTSYQLPEEENKGRGRR